MPTTPKAKKDLDESPLKIERRRLKKVAKDQAAAREKGGIEPTHAIVSCPSCAAQLLIGTGLLKHRV